MAAEGVEEAMAALGWPGCEGAALGENERSFAPPQPPARLPSSRSGRIGGVDDAHRADRSAERKNSLECSLAHCGADSDSSSPAIQSGQQQAEAAPPAQSASPSSPRQAALFQATRRIKYTLSSPVLAAADDGGGVAPVCLCAYFLIVVVLLPFGRTRFSCMFSTILPKAREPHRLPSATPAELWRRPELSTTTIAQVARWRGRVFVLFARLERETKTQFVHRDCGAHKRSAHKHSSRCTSTPSTHTHTSAEFVCSSSQAESARGRLCLCVSERADGAGGGNCALLALEEVFALFWSIGLLVRTASMLICTRGAH